jgi:hypothetical protein
MKETTSELLEKVDKEHDWREGQVYGGNGTYLSSTDVCRVCGLRRFWETDRQNHIDNEYSFRDENDQPITLKEAAARKCLPESE